jgi:hypothetical protein
MLYRYRLCRQRPESIADFFLLLISPCIVFPRRLCKAMSIIEKAASTTQGKGDASSLATSNTSAAILEDHENQERTCSTKHLPPTHDTSTDDFIEANPNHLSGIPLALTLIALSSAVFCVALDMTIIATAIPRITDEFHALQDIGWYGSAYLLTTCGESQSILNFVAEIC